MAASSLLRPQPDLDESGKGGSEPNLRSNAALDINAASIPTTAELTGFHAPSMNAQASPGVQREGSPSQEQYLGPGAFRSASNSSKVLEPRSVICPSPSARSRRDARKRSCTSVLCATNLVARANAMYRVRRPRKNAPPR